MTTTARPSVGQPRGTTQRVLLLAVLSCLVALVVLVLVGALAVGSAASGGAAVGGGVSLLFLFFGAATVANATRISPQVSLVVAMTTFLFVVVMVAGVFYLLDASGAVGSSLSPRWLAGGVALTALTWTVALVVGHARSRIPAYDLPAEPRGRDAQGAAHAAPEHVPGQTEVRAR